MIAWWRLVLAAMVVVAAFFLVRPATDMVLGVIRSRIHKRFRWIVDVQRFMAAHLAWLVFFGVLWIVALEILDVTDTSEVKRVLLYLTAVPVVLATLALRRVVTNICIRHFHWDRDAADYTARTFVVTESIKFTVFALVLVEIFFIFFKSSGFAQLLLVEVFFGLEILVLLAGFTVLRNVATGLFLIFAEPFRTGSLCRVRDLVGFIERVSLARTIMRRRDGCRIFIPNGIFADTHQTSGTALELRHHELLLRLHPGTSADAIQLLVDDLRATLPKFAVAPVMDTRYDHLPASRGLSAASDSVGTPPYAGTPQANSFTNNTNGLSSFRSSVESRLMPGWDDDAGNQTVSVELHDMYVVKVSVEVDRDQFSSFEAAKTEINMAILESIQRLCMDVQQLTRAH